MLRSDGGGEYASSEFSMFCEFKPDVSHFKIFGSLCYKHVPKQLRRKLDDRGTPHILVGYHVTGSYRLFDPISRKVSISKDVNIDEATSWTWTTTE